jgi:hypothetical protein
VDWPGVSRTVPILLVSQELILSLPMSLYCNFSCRNGDGVELYNEIEFYAKVNSKVRAG